MLMPALLARSNAAYTAPPAPVSVPLRWKLMMTLTARLNTESFTAWNASSRSPCFQAEPVSTCDELPLDYLQGHKDGSGGLAGGRSQSSANRRLVVRRPSSISPGGLAEVTDYCLLFGLAAPPVTPDGLDKL